MRAVAAASGPERGFSFVELLVVILILSVLAAIAIPSFLSETSKAYDASATELARTAETAADVVAGDDGGSFAGVSVAELGSSDATIQTSSAGDEAWLVDAAGSSSSFYVVAEAHGTNDWFEVERDNGAVYQFCGPTRGSSAVAWPTTMTQTSPVYGGPPVGTCVDGSW